MASDHTEHSLDEQFEFTAESKRRLLIGLGLGVAMVAIGSFLLAAGVGDHEVQEVVQGTGASEGHDNEHAYKWTNRLYANIWLNAIYFIGASVIGMFFISYNYLAQAGWSSAFKRIPEAMPAYVLPMGIIIVAVFFLAGHDLFHWTNPDLYDTTSKSYDPIIAGKLA